MASYFRAGVLLMSQIVLANASPIVIAHRGASGYLPEHTLIGASMAYAMGADFIEPDLVLTKDNVPVVLHDIQLEDTTDVSVRFPEKKRVDGRFYAIDLTLFELKQLRVHERVILSSGQKVFPGRFPLNHSRFEVPTFAELIELVIGLNHSTGKNVGLYPEIKEPRFHLNEGKDIAKIIATLVKCYEAKLGKAPLYWQCFHAETLKRFKTEFASKYPRILLIEDGDLELTHLDRLDKQLSEIAAYSDGIGPSLTHVFDEQGHSTRLVELAHKHNLLVHAYTVRSDALPTYVETLDLFLKKIFLDEKVDGVFTDFTDKVVHFLWSSRARDPSS
jgi:glycerophosphoryl diester phosphodiesterase